MDATRNAWATTLYNFKAGLNWRKPLSYLAWMNLPDDLKAAALFVQFYEEIILAWYKVCSFYTTAEEGVSTALQYLQKNVEKIKADERRYRSSYIYQVAYNCLYCICHDYKYEKETFQNTRSNIVVSGDSEVDLFDSILGEGTMEGEIIKKEFWALLEDADEETYAVINVLLGADCPCGVMGDDGKVARRISKKRKEEVIEQLKVRLAPMRELYGV